MMQRKATLLTGLFIGSLLVTGCQTSKENAKENSNPAADTTWAILPFNKVDSVNPIVLTGEHQFRCPVTSNVVKWEEKDVFKPAAVVKDGKVFPLFRAEDKIGKYAGTSRIGQAVSDDGLHFSKME